MMHLRGMASGSHRVPATDRKAGKDKPRLASGVLMKFPRAVAEVARVSTIGAVKYGVPTDDQNFLGARSPEPYLDAALRHLVGHYHGPVNVEQGGELRPEGHLCLHLAQAAWSMLAALENYLLVAEEAGLDVAGILEDPPQPEPGPVTAEQAGELVRQAGPRLVP